MKSKGPRRARGPGGSVLLTPRQVARQMGVTPGTLEAWRLRGGGPKFVRVSKRCIRYRRQDVESWIEERIRSSTSDSGGHAG
jgi:predicted DNA-binding transcriptional regulator AlpA